MTPDELIAEAREPYIAEDVYATAELLPRLADALEDELKRTAKLHEANTRLAARAEQLRQALARATNPHRRD